MLCTSSNARAETQSWCSDGFDESKLQGEPRRYLLSLKVEEMCNQVLHSREINLWHHMEAIHKFSPITAGMDFDQKIIKETTCPGASFAQSDTVEALTKQCLQLAHRIIDQREEAAVFSSEITLVQSALCCQGDHTGMTMKLKRYSKAEHTIWSY